jgi:very-short-patch-repair endonuclease
LPAPPADKVIARLATGQKGAVAHRQLLDVGVASSSITRRVATGRLHRAFHGVYLVGHQALAPFASESAALLACGLGTVLSHESAAVAWSILTDYTGVIHVTVRGRQLHQRAGLCLHWTTTLHDRDIRRRHELPVTSPGRTLFDLAATASPHLEHAFVEAHGRRLVSAGELHRMIERIGPRPGIRALRALIAANEFGFTRSKAERLLRKLLRAGGLPEPLFNAFVLGHMVDCLWPEHRLVVEFDGSSFHGHRRAFETDRRLDAALVAGGYRVIRITWLQLNVEPFAVLATVAAALAKAEPIRTDRA